MSIESEILRIQRNVADAYSAVASKGGIVPSTPTVANLAEAISGIPQQKIVGGNPIGTVISFMGTSAPDDYLICDGAIYNISSYSDLSNFFAEQFGAKNYFGGNGTTTFAVPDMRNLFLRGYHGSSTEKLSGDIGKKQDATVIPSVYIGGSSSNSAIIGMKGKGTTLTKTDNIDAVSVIASAYGVFGATTGASVTAITGNVESYTTRPVNMAVLYCIKAVISN